MAGRKNREEHNTTVYQHSTPHATSPPPLEALVRWAAVGVLEKHWKAWKIGNSNHKQHRVLGT